EVACRRGLDQRAVTALARALGDALGRPAFREVVGEAVDDVLARYRERMGAYPRFWMGVASLLGLIDRERLVAALHAGLLQVAGDPDHPVRQRLTEALAGLPERLRRDPARAARVEAATRDLLTTPAAAVSPSGSSRSMRSTPSSPSGSTAPSWAASRAASSTRSISCSASSRSVSDPGGGSEGIVAPFGRACEVAPFDLVHSASRSPEPTGGQSMTRLRIAELFASLVLLTLALVGPATSQAPPPSPTPKAGGTLNLMLREDLPQGFAIHETATISTVWPAMPCLNNLVLFD